MTWPVAGRATIRVLGDASARMLVTVAGEQGEWHWLLQQEGNPLAADNESWAWQWARIHEPQDTPRTIQIEDQAHRLFFHSDAGIPERTIEVLLVDTNGVPRGPYRMAGKALEALKASAGLGVTESDDGTTFVIRLSSQATGLRYGRRAFLLSDNSTFCLEVELGDAGEIVRVMPVAVQHTYRSDGRQSGMALDRAGRLLAVRLGEWKDEESPDLRPEAYWPREAQHEEKPTAAQLLGDMRNKQKEAARRIDFLMGLVELSPLDDASIPLRCAEDLEPVVGMGDLQQQIWEKIKAQSDKVADDGKSPRPFLPEDLTIKDFSTDDVTNTLELLRRMGLVVAVTIDGAPYYRLAAKSDIEA